MRVVGNSLDTYDPECAKRRGKRDDAMAFVPAVDCAEAVIGFIGDGGNYNNVLNFKYATAYDQSNIDDLADAVDGAVGSDYLAILSDQVSYVNTHVRGLTSSVDLEGVANASASTGGDSDSPLPSNATLCVSLRTGLTGRSARGRFYSVGATFGDVLTADVFTAAYVAAVVATIVAISTQAGAAGWTLVVLSRRNAGVALTAAVARPVTQIYAVDNNVDSQRRRLKGRGI